MKNIIVGCVLLLFSGLTVFSTSSWGADVNVKFSIQESMEVEKVKALFSDNVKFYWGDTAHPAVVKKFGTFKTSKRTNAFAKARSNACGWAMASALVALRDRAEREGGNAVINIKSNIKDIEESSETEFSCLAGKVMVNVALKGTVVSLAN